MLQRFRKKILPPHLVLGKRGEKMAEHYLHGKGWRIIERNYVCRAGEIDLIADDHGTLVFVEVRTREGSIFGSAGQTVDADKERRVGAAAEEYLRGWRCPELKTRFDLVTIDLDPAGGTPEIRHLPAAF